ncbi:oligopeptide/dipeptide ABC transporter ATP-binding protein [Yoonia sediminilitoris]|uniref:Oligopeptide/dipeptide ABC transporter ATP-binding protein n=1 Tax=Yoonia sediminilitoris TaxID=1286148 RepID=A0A2T6KS15_9RHOB|nr:oligopeptide/dipeptide ABC transporter ATP-binding protein [Yoonia sediminilitoris]RCW99516.1 oligopeptide/dipeptide ABC transporter ATP-binding protein [Yoonia sediminilitoris]
MTPEELRDVRGSQIPMIFQEPMASLNPAMRIGKQLMEVPMIHEGVNAEEAYARALEVVTDVKLPDPERMLKSFPHQLSGDQQQRIVIARALAGDARIVVADEPVSALDVSVQAAVTDLLMEIQREHKTTLLFNSHDLSIVRYLSDRVMVMYLGHVVEMGTTDQVFAPPNPPYTEALLSVVPIADTSVNKKHILLEGDIPSAMNPPSGCPFQTRCGWKSKVPGNRCETHVPDVRKLQGAHQIKCHLTDKQLADMEPVIKIAAE